MRKRWFVIGGILITITCFMVCQLLINTHSGEMIDMMINEQTEPNITNFESQLGLDSPLYTRVFNNIVIPAPEFYPPSSYLSSYSSESPVSINKNMETAATGDGDIVSRMIVRTADLSLIVNNIDATISEITQLASIASGYVVTANKTSTDELISATVSIRIPASEFDFVLRNLRYMAVKINSENIAADDVSEEFNDLTAKLKNLEVTEIQLQDIMKKAEKVEDVLAIQSQLTLTREEIEIIQGKMKYLESTAEMSLITINLHQSTLTIKLHAGTRYARTKDYIGFAVDIQGGIGPFSYNWDFGDGVISVESEPWHVFNDSGQYTVSVTVTDDKGNKATDKRANYVTVYPGWSPGDVFNGAWRGFLSFLRFLFTVLIWIVIFCPIIIIAITVFYIIRRIWRKRNSKSSVINNI